MKALKPSMRENKRYLLVKGKIEDIEKSIRDFIGDFGMSKTGLNFIETGKDYAIISVNREAVNNVRASFCVWPENISVKRVSGTIKGLKNKIK
jgi:RNase P/RNase MRP subunit POP5